MKPNQGSAFLITQEAISNILCIIENTTKTSPTVGIAFGWYEEQIDSFIIRRLLPGLNHSVPPKAQYEGTTRGDIEDDGDEAEREDGSDTKEKPICLWLMSKVPVSIDKSTTDALPKIDEKCVVMNINKDKASVSLSLSKESLSGNIHYLPSQEEVTDLLSHIRHLVPSDDDIVYDYEKGQVSFSIPGTESDIKVNLKKLSIESSGCKVHLKDHFSHKAFELRNYTASRGLSGRDQFSNDSNRSRQSLENQGQGDRSIAMSKLIHMIHDAIASTGKEYGTTLDAMTSILRYTERLFETPTGGNEDNRALVLKADLPNSVIRLILFNGLLELHPHRQDTSQEHKSEGGPILYTMIIKPFYVSVISEAIIGELGNTSNGNSPTQHGSSPSKSPSCGEKEDPDEVCVCYSSISIPDLINSQTTEKDDSEAEMSISRRNNKEPIAHDIQPIATGVFLVRDATNELRNHIIKALSSYVPTVLRDFLGQEGTSNNVVKEVKFAGNERDLGKTKQNPAVSGANKPKESKAPRNTTEVRPGDHSHDHSFTASEGKIQDSVNSESPTSTDPKDKSVSETSESASESNKSETSKEDKGIERGDDYPEVDADISRRNQQEIISSHSFCQASAFVLVESLMAQFPDVRVRIGTGDDSKAFLLVQHKDFLVILRAILKGSEFETLMSFHRCVNFRKVSGNKHRYSFQYLFEVFGPGDSVYCTMFIKFFLSNVTSNTFNCQSCFTVPSRCNQSVTGQVDMNVNTNETEGQATSSYFDLLEAVAANLKHFDLFLIIQENHCFVISNARTALQRVSRQGGDIKERERMIRIRHGNSEFTVDVSTSSVTDANDTPTQTTLAERDLKSCRSDSKRITLASNIMKLISSAITDPLPEHSMKLLLSAVESRLHARGCTGFRVSVNGKTTSSISYDDIMYTITGTGLVEYPSVEVQIIKTKESVAAHAQSNISSIDLDASARLPCIQSDRTRNISGPVGFGTIGGGEMSVSGQDTLLHQSQGALTLGKAITASSQQLMGLTPSTNHEMSVPTLSLCINKCTCVMHYQYPIFKLISTLVSLFENNLAVPSLGCVVDNLYGFLMKSESSLLSSSPLSSHDGSLANTTRHETTEGRYKRIQRVSNNILLVRSPGIEVVVTPSVNDGQTSEGMMDSGAFDVLIRKSERGRSSHSVNGLSKVVNEIVLKEVAPTVLNAVTLRKINEMIRIISTRSLSHSTQVDVGGPGSTIQPVSTPQFFSTSVVSLSSPSTSNSSSRSSSPNMSPSSPIPTQVVSPSTTSRHLVGRHPTADNIVLPAEIEQQEGVEDFKGSVEKGHETLIEASLPQCYTFPDIMKIKGKYMMYIQDTPVVADSRSELISRYLVVTRQRKSRLLSLFSILTESRETSVCDASIKDMKIINDKKRLELVLVITTIEGAHYEVRGEGDTIHITCCSPMIPEEISARGYKEKRSVGQDQQQQQQQRPVTIQSTSTPSLTETERVTITNSNDALVALSILELIFRCKTWDTLLRFVIRNVRATSTPRFLPSVFSAVGSTDVCIDCVPYFRTPYLDGIGIKVVARPLDKLSTSNRLTQASTNTTAATPHDTNSPLTKTQLGSSGGEWSRSIVSGTLATAVGDDQSRVTNHLVIFEGGTPLRPLVNINGSGELARCDRGDIVAFFNKVVDDIVQALNPPSPSPSPSPSPQLPSLATNTGTKSLPSGLVRTKTAEAAESKEMVGEAVGQQSSGRNTPQTTTGTNERRRQGVINIDIKTLISGTGDGDDEAKIQKDIEAIDEMIINKSMGPPSEQGGPKAVTNTTSTSTNTSTNTNTNTNTSATREKKRGQKGQKSSSQHHESKTHRLSTAGTGAGSQHQAVTENEETFPNVNQGTTSQYQAPILCMTDYPPELSDFFDKAAFVARIASLAKTEVKEVAAEPLRLSFTSHKKIYNVEYDDSRDSYRFVIIELQDGKDLRVLERAKGKGCEMLLEALASSLGSE